MVTGVDQVVLQTAAIADVPVEFVCAFLSAKGEGLGIDPSFLNLIALISIWNSPFTVFRFFFRRQCAGTLQSAGCSKRFSAA